MKALNYVIFLGVGQAFILRHAITLQNNKSANISGKGGVIYLLHVVTFPWKWQCYHVALVGYGPAYPKFSKITNCQYPWKGLSGFVDFFHAVIWILSDIHWSYKNRLFWAGIVRHRLSANQIVRYALTLKTRKSYEVSSWVFASIEATKNILSWVRLQNTLGQSVCRIFCFWLV